MSPSHDAILGLGSNLGDGPANIRAALDALAQDGVDIVRMSSLYQTSPVGPQDQPDFTNAAAHIRTTRAPEDLLALCKDIEHGLGRTAQTVRWGPRAMDIDILLFDRLALQTPCLVIPHPEMGDRLFVLLPLLEIAPDFLLPEGKTIINFAQPRITALKTSGQKILKIVEIPPTPA
jgi:2-amino-4-hydroxy-6-hydroxymethyldihydropteridine diphosphokinase